MIPLTERERCYLGLALSNYGDVQMHLRPRVEELLDLTVKLEIRPDQLSKGLSKMMAARLNSAKGGQPA